MKTLFFLFLLFFNLAHGFEPICNSPQDIKKSDLKKIFKEKVSRENQLILYSVNPPNPIDWSTPGKAFKSIFKNSFITEGYDIEENNPIGTVTRKKHPIKTHFIGHMFIGLSCNGFPSIMTGMSSPGHEEIKGLLIDGKSFSQIISTTSGHFNSSEELEKEVEIRKEKVGNLYYMGVNLSQNSCEELLKYLTEYKACGVDKRYGGLNANPHRGEGAGCSAFSLSFLQRLNIMPDISEIKKNQFGSEFVREINIPKSMLIHQGKNPEVGAWGLLKGNNIQWARNSDDGINVKFFDPELFSNWIRKFEPSEQKIPGLKYLGNNSNQKVKGIWFTESQLNIEESQFNIDYLLEE